jgi:hypothetical protein
MMYDVWSPITQKIDSVTIIIIINLTEFLSCNKQPDYGVTDNSIWLAQNDSINENMPYRKVDMIYIDSHFNNDDY